MISIAIIPAAGKGTRMLPNTRSYPKELMEFEICPEEGIRILESFKGVENLLSGSARIIALRSGLEEAKRDFIAEAAAGKI